MASFSGLFMRAVSRSHKRRATPAQHMRAGLSAAISRSADCAARVVSEECTEGTHSRLLIPKSVGLPPLECCRGTSPSQAANRRPSVKALVFSDRGHKRGGCDRADVRDASHPLAVRILPLACLDMGLEIMGLAIQLLQMGGEPRDQWRIVSGRPFSAFSRIRGMCFVTWSGPCGITSPNSELDLVALRGARLDEALTGAMRRQDRLIVGGLHGHEAHAGARHGLTDRLGAGGPTSFLLVRA